MEEEMKEIYQKLSDKSKEVLKIVMQGMLIAEDKKQEKVN